MVNSAKQSRLACARIRIASSLSLLATTRTPNFTLPPGRGRPGGASRTGGRGIKAQNRCGCPAAARRSLWQKSGANESREQLCPAAIAAMYGRHLLQCKNEKAYSRGRQTNVQLLQFCTAWGRCMAWGRRQTQNVHCSCLYVYTRTAVSCMGRSARVQRGQAIICSTAAGANCRSVTCARSAH